MHRLFRTFVRRCHLSTARGDSHGEASFQQTTISGLTSVVLEILDEVDYDRKTPFTICDYGAAHGVNTLPLLLKIIDTIESKYGRDTEFNVVFNDTINNDFRRLFSFYEGNSGGLDLRARHNVNLSTVGRSFYEKVVARNSVHFGISFHSTHWLEDCPPLRTACFPHLAAPYEAAQVEQVAMAQLVRFLTARKVELQNGGKMFLPVMVQEPSLMKRLCVTMECLQKALRVCVQRGVITDSQLKRVNINIFLRDKEKMAELLSQSAYLRDVRLIEFDVHHRSPPAVKSPAQLADILTLVCKHTAGDAIKAAVIDDVEDADGVLEAVMREVNHVLRGRPWTVDLPFTSTSYCCLVL